MARTSPKQDTLATENELEEFVVQHLMQLLRVFGRTTRIIFAIEKNVGLRFVNGFCVRIDKGINGEALSARAAGPGSVRSALDLPRSLADARKPPVVFYPLTSAPPRDANGHMKSGFQTIGYATGRQKADAVRKFVGLVRANKVRVLDDTHLVSGGSLLDICDTSAAFFEQLARYYDDGKTVSGKEGDQADDLATAGILAVDAIDCALAEADEARDFASSTMREFRASAHAAIGSISEATPYDAQTKAALTGLYASLQAIAAGS